MTKHILAAAVMAALAAGVAADQQKKSFSELDRNNDEKLSRDEWQAGQGAAAGASGKRAQRGSAAVVLVPFVIAQTPNFADGCWARLYDGENYEGDQLTVIGPGDMPNMRTASGTDWSGSFDSLQVGPKATLTVYDNENYTQKVATYRPNQRIADLGETRGFFEDIRSLKIACSGSAATGGTEKGEGR